MSSEIQPGLNDRQPLVSVVIPVYNCSEYISRALQSVFSQTYRRYEVIVIDDGSTDLVSLERELQPYRSRITYVTQANSGPSAARNAALRLASGELVAFLDADDWWFPQFLSEQVDVLVKNPEISGVYSDLVLTGDSKWEGRTFMDRCPIVGPPTLENLIVEDCHVAMSSMVARKQALFAAGMFDEQLRRSEDYDLWLRMTVSGMRLTYQRKALACHTYREGSLSSDALAMSEAILAVYAKFLVNRELPAEAKALLHKRIRAATREAKVAEARINLEDADYRSALDALRAAQAVSPTLKVKLLIAGLRHTPKITAWGVRVWYRYLSSTHRLKSRRQNGQGAWPPVAVPTSSEAVLINSIDGEEKDQASATRVAR